MLGLSSPKGASGQQPFPFSYSGRFGRGRGDLTLECLSSHQTARRPPSSAAPTIHHRPEQGERRMAPSCLKSFTWVFSIQGIVVLLQVGRVYATLKPAHMLSRHHVRGPKLLLHPHHVSPLVGRHPSRVSAMWLLSLPTCHIHGYTGSGLSYSLGPGCCM